MNRFWVLLGLLTIGFSLRAQLTEGTIIYRSTKPRLVGTIISGTEVLNVHGDTVKFNPQNVYYMRNFEEKLTFGDARYHPLTGYFGQWDIGLGLDASVHSHVAFKVGKRLDSRTSVGVGLGFHNSSQSIALPALGTVGEIVFNAPTVNLSAEGRYFLNEWKRRPYVSGELGVGFAQENDWDNLRMQRGGLYAEFGVGLQFPTRKYMRYFVQLTQYVQKYSAQSVRSENPLDPSFRVNMWFRHVNLVLGLRFK